MVVIRLSRGGSKKSPFYHVVATDKRSPRDGRYVEKLGYFNPIARGEQLRFHINQERFDYWVSVGAQPSNRVTVLMKELAKGTSGITIKKEKKVAEKAAAAVVEEEVATTETAAEETTTTTKTTEETPEKKITDESKPEESE